MCMASTFLGKYTSIISMDLIEHKKFRFLNFFRESNLVEARFEIILSTILLE